MSDLDFIKNRLPADHGFTEPDIAAEYAANDNNKFLTLGALFDRLAAGSNYKSESIGNYSYNDPLYQHKADYWRGQSNDPGTADDRITFVKATGLDFVTTSYSSGTELG